MEQQMQQTQQPPVPPQGQTADPFSGQVMATLEASLARSGFVDGVGLPSTPPSTPVPQTVAPTARPEARQVPVQGEPRQVVISTQPVGDVSAMFSDKAPAVPQVQAPQVTLPPDTPIEAPEGLTDRANHAWQEIRQREKQARQAAESYRMQYEKAIKDAGAIADERVQFTDALKQKDDRISQLEEELGKLDLAHKPEFKEQYDRPMDVVLSQLSDVVRDSTNLEGDKQVEDAVKRLVDADDTEFNRLVGKLPASVQGSLLDKRREYLRLSDARGHAISEWRTSQAGVEAVGDQQRIVERAQRRRDMAEKAIDFSKLQVPYEHRLSVLIEPTYSKDVESVDKSFRGFMQEAKDEDIARAAYQGFLMPVVQRQLAFMTQAMEEWRNAYNSLRGISSPPAMPMRVQGSTPPPVAPPPPALAPGRGFKDTLENTVEQSLRRSGFGSV